MLKYLSQEWLDAWRSLSQRQPYVPNADARLQYTITDTPEGVVSYWQVVDGGRVVETGIGVLEDADVTLTIEYGTAVKLQKLELSPTTAVMTRKIKVKGKLPKLMGLMPVSTSPEYKQVQAELSGQTIY